jgi:hypothetical protein
MGSMRVVNFGIEVIQVVEINLRMLAAVSKFQHVYFYNSRHHSNPQTLPAVSMPL